MICIKHDYEIIKDYTLESPIIELFKKGNFEVEGIPISAFTRKLIIVYKCKKCNKIKESIISNTR